MLEVLFLKERPSLQGLAGGSTGYVKYDICFAVEWDSPLGNPLLYSGLLMTPSGFSFRSVAPLPSHAETTSPSGALTRTMGRRT